MRSSLLIRNLLFLTLIASLPNPASAEGSRPYGPEREEPIGIMTTIDQSEFKCFSTNDWAELGGLILHYHSLYRIAGLQRDKLTEQDAQIDNLTRYKNELLVAQNQTLITGDNLRLELESERRKKRLFAWFSSISGGVAVVLGFVLYGVSK